MSSTSKKADVAAGLSKLSLATTKNPSKSDKKKKSKKPVADSWEDEDVSSGSDSETAGLEESAKEGVAAPPPTPMTPTYRTTGPWTAASEPTSPNPPLAGDVSPSRRPEKTDAVARRMIASALGVKVPKQTEEQKAYEKAIREQEKKRRETERVAEKERQAQAEKAKAAIWDD